MRTIQKIGLGVGFAGCLGAVGCFVKETGGGGKGGESGTTTATGSTSSSTGGTGGSSGTTTTGSTSSSTTTGSTSSSTTGSTSSGTGGAPNPCGPAAQPATATSPSVALPGNAVGAVGDSVDVYWAYTGWSCNGGILRESVTGGAPTFVVPSLTGFGDVTGFALDGDNLLLSFGSCGSAVGPTGGGAVGRAPKGGGAVTLLETGEVATGISLTAQNGRVCWSAGSAVRCMPESGGTPSTVFQTTDTLAWYSLQGDYAYVETAVGSNATLLRVPVAGGPTTTLFTGLIRAFGYNATDAFVAVGTDIVRVPLTGGAPVTITTGLSGTIGALLADNRCVYWLENASTVKRVATAGGPAALFSRVDVAGSLTWLAQDDAAIYAVDTASQSSSIYQVLK